MAKLPIIYHSHTGNTEEMAKAVHEEARSAGATVTRQPIQRIVAFSLAMLK